MTEVYKNYAKNFLKQGGISMGKMRNLLTKTYNKKKFFNSNIDYGLVTYNLTKMEPVFLKKERKRRPTDSISLPPNTFWHIWISRILPFVSKKKSAKRRIMLTVCSPTAVLPRTFLRKASGSKKLPSFSKPFYSVLPSKVSIPV